MRSRRCGLVGALGVSALTVALASRALAAEPASARYDWSGFYVGGHFGYSAGGFGPGTSPVPSLAFPFSSGAIGSIGGFQLGHNWQFANGFVVGIEADTIFGGPVDRAKVRPAPFYTNFDYAATVRGRLGYAAGHFLPYVTGGFAVGRASVVDGGDLSEINPSPSSTHTGWTVGAGVEYALTGPWRAKLEYNYVSLGAKTVTLADSSQLRIDPGYHFVKMGLNYRLGASAAGVLPDSDDWSIHGQTTYLPQGYRAIRSPYEGANSLPGRGQFQATWTATAFVGRRLWEGGEFYFNPEMSQGFGLAQTLGLGGFSNGEAQKAGAQFPKFRAQRYFLRQTFGLGGEQETVEEGPNQLGGKRDIDRVTVTVGRFAVGDIFDGNSYAKDPRADFMNWSMWSSAAYDFPADLPGLTRGAVVELNRKAWALRFGAFQVPKEPNSDVLTFRTGGLVGEFEGRYDLLGQPGKFRVGVFANRGRTANYRDVLTLASVDPALDINDITANMRRQQTKNGFYLNGEQAITADIGTFARLSWNDGKSEILSFTDIDRSASAGVVIKGTAWSRPNDRIGIAGAVNGLSGPHRDFLAAGGLGLLIGDGALNYRSEKIFEAFYAYALTKWATVTFDYQYIANPAYNADRGPASIFSGRLHAEF